MDQTKILTDADRAELAQAKATADMILSPIFKALGVKDAKGLAPKAPRLCDECRTEIESGYQCRSCANFEARTFGDGDDS